MAYKVNYAGIDLHNYMKILNVRRSLLPPRTNYSKDIPNVHGEYYTGYKYTPKTIVLECLIVFNGREDFMDKIRQISYILDVKRPSALIIDDENDKYINAIIDGTIDVEKAFKTGTFEVPFLCHNPISYSREDDYFLSNDDSGTTMTINNSGTAEAYPRINIHFKNDAHFLQATNYEGKTILVGRPPDIEKNVGTTRFYLRDSFSNLNGWTNAGTITGGQNMGSLKINTSNYALIPESFGTSNVGWHGCAMKKSIGRNLDEFEFKVKLQHSSQGNFLNNDIPINAQYKTLAETKIRRNAGVEHEPIGMIPRGVVVTVKEVSNGFAKTTYKEKTGWITLDSIYIYNETVSTKSGVYKVNNAGGVILRENRGTYYNRIVTIPNETIVTISDISLGWGKVEYNSHEGYVPMQYMLEINDNKMIRATPSGSAENQLGKIEISGFTNTGVKLFTFSIKDSHAFHEYTQPEIYIGNKLVLDDSESSPTAITSTVTDSNGKTSIQKLNSGSFGCWNDFRGWFTIKKTRNNKGKNEWYCSVEKCKEGSDLLDGNPIKFTTKDLSGNYVDGQLSYITIWMAQYKDYEPVEIMNVREFRVKDLANIVNSQQEFIFSTGDELTIDCESRKVYLNGFLFMNDVDIGSEFFSCPVGKSQFLTNSDDKEHIIETTITKRWL